MLRNNPEYRRLKLGGYGAMGSSSYWLGKDHLLVVVVAGYKEKYQRFRYADIQGLVLRKTRVHYLWGFAFAALALGSAVVALETELEGSAKASDPTALIVSGILGLIFFGLTILNAVAGAGCVSHLRTALQTFSLPQVRRWRRAQALVTELTPLIVTAQGVAITAAPMERLAPEQPGDHTTPAESS
jgi:hypothetical protein